MTRERCRRARNFDCLLLHDAQKLGLRIQARIIRGQNVRGGAFLLGLHDRALRFEIEILQEEALVFVEIMKRGQQAGLFVIVVVALRPERFRQRRILAVPGARVFFRVERALERVRAAVAKRFVEAADAVVHGGDEHQVARRPGVEHAVRENAGHAELGHVRDVAPADHFPFVGENRIDPGVEGAVARGVVVKIGNGFVQIVQHLRFPIHVGVQHVFGELERDAHGVAIVVVRDVLAPINQRRIEILGMRQMPAIDVHHAIAAIDFDDRSDQRDHAVANFVDVGAFVDGEAIGQLHQRGGRAGFGGMDRAGDVVDRDGLGDELVGFRVIELDGARIGELRETRAIFFEIFQILRRGDGHGDHLAAFFRFADGEDLDARAGLFEQAHVFVHVFGVGQDSGRAGHVAEHDFRRRNSLRGGQIVHERRGEERLGGVLLDFRGVGLVDGLLGIASGRSFAVAKSDGACQGQNEQPGKTSQDMYTRFSMTNHLFLPAMQSGRRIVSQTLFGGDKCYAHRGRHVDGLACGREAAGGGIDVEDDDVVGFLVFGKQVRAGGIDGEMTRSFAAGQNLAEGSQSTFLLRSMAKIAMLSWPRFEA